MRRLALILLALLLALGAGSEGMQAALVPTPPGCCCGDIPQPEPCPCGPSQCPTNPRTPRPVGPGACVAPLAGQTAQAARPRLPQETPHPWAGLFPEVAPRNQARPTARAHAPPSPPDLHRLCTLRN